MIIASFQNVVKEYGGTPLFEPLTFRIDQKERIALIGPNGTGKSTILKMLIGKLRPESGQIVIGKEYRIGYLSQEVIADLSHTLFEEAQSIFAPLLAQEKKLTEICAEVERHPADQELMSQYADLEQRFSAAGGYNYRYMIDMMLFRFGFSKADYGRPLLSFSGGERMKAAFVKLLLLSPDLLILDEPTNNLDIATIEWLEEYLKSYAGSLLFVSHDRYFINSLAQRIFELDQHKLTVYTGDYDDFSRQKQALYEQQLKLYRHQQEEARKLERFIEFYMPKPRFASRAHDREKKLARLQDRMVDKPVLTHSHLKMSLDGYSRKGKKIIELKDVAIGYEDHRLVSGINITVRGGDRLALMGANGSGKTTLLKCLLGKLRPLSGLIVFSERPSLGYLQQDNVLISSPYPVFDYIKSRFPQMADQEIYDHLGHYAFSYEDDRKTVDSLSGGERMRLVFAELELHSYDLLILDEPTNHLDMMTKEELIEALDSYQGTLIIVTHDRYFADSVCDRLLYFERGKPYAYEGKYSDFKTEVMDRIESELALEAVKEDKAEPKPSHGYKPTHEAKARPRFSKDKIEEKMARLEKEVGALRKSFDDPTVYQDTEKAAESESRLKSAEAEYASLLEMLAYYE